MVSTSYLRVYQPASVFRTDDSERWLATPADPESLDGRSVARWLVKAALPAGEIETEGAFVRKLNGEPVICPFRTRLRVLSGLLAFRGSVPEEVAEAFVPEEEARRAAAELASLGENNPEMRSHMLQANWHVPLRWFAAFDGSEKTLTEDRHGLRIRYETRLSAARARLKKALLVLEEAWIDESVAGAVRELTGWLGDFPSDGLLELDYGTVAAAFTDEDLLEDRSAADVWTCMDALAAGETDRAGEIFGDLSDRWLAVRAREVLN